MRLRCHMIGFAALAVLLFGPPVAEAQHRTQFVRAAGPATTSQAAAENYAPGHLIVKFHKGTSSFDAAGVRSTYRLDTLARSPSTGPELVRVALGEEATTLA